MLRIVFFFILYTTAICAHAQTVRGFALSKGNNQRLAQVYIYNENTEEGIYNNSKGEFTIKANKGDVIYAAKEGYALDTIIYNGQSAIYFQLTALAIQIERVNIMGDKLDPMAQYLRTRQEYKRDTDKGVVKDVFSVSNATVGLSIDAIFALLSKQGRNSRYLQKILERDYRDRLIDYKFNADMVTRVLNIKDPELTDFMQQYRPTYNFILSASDYTLSIFIKNSYASYKRAPAAFRLPNLKTTKEGAADNW